jgi:hypothetical protein
VLGTALGLKHGLRAMRPGGAAGNGGAIVNIASVAATIAFPGIGGYSATKSAVDRLTRVAAFEAGKLGFGVRVNCVYPGLVPTEMGQKLAVDMAELGLFASPEAAVGAVIEQTPAGRLGEVSDMADAVVFLASDQRASSREPGCRSTVGWACELMGSLTDYLDKGRRWAATRPAWSRASRCPTATYKTSATVSRARSRATASSRAPRSASSARTTPSRSRACSASPAAARCGARSTRATSWPRPARCSSSSTAST